MTKIYFVRHAEPEHAWENDRTRPLTAEGMRDSEKVRETLAPVRLDFAISSPYVRSMETIRRCADNHGLQIYTDERLREREKGPGGNNYGMFQKRWSNFRYHEDGGESLAMVQARNMEAVLELLGCHRSQNILFGTHGTALSTILNYFNPDFGCGDFLRIIDYMPYIIRLDFEGLECVCKEELLIVSKEFKGKNRADLK